MLTNRADLSCLSVCLLLALASSIGAQGSEHHKLLPGDGAAGDYFGSAVATDGVLLAVGAAQADESGLNSGSAYIYAAPSGVQLFELVPSDGAPGDRFGSAIATDGGLVAVGSPFSDGVGMDSGAVYIFHAGTGTQLFKLQAGNAAAGDQFGSAVAMDGDLVVIGSLGSAYVFDASTGQELRELVPTGGTTTFGLSGFGEAVAIDAGRILVGARLENGVSGRAGAAYVFDVSSGNQLHRLIALDGTAWANFGASVDLDGSTAVIGAPEASPNFWHSGAAYLFDVASGQQSIKIVPSDGHLQAKFGSSVGIDGLHIAIGARQDNAGGLFSSGSTYVYDANASFVIKLTASDAAPHDDLGGAVAVAGGVLVAGAPVDFPVSVPSLGGLTGLQFYLQGVFFAPPSSPEPARLTGGLEVVLGGYL